MTSILPNQGAFPPFVQLEATTVLASIQGQTGLVLISAELARQLHTGQLTTHLFYPNPDAKIGETIQAIYLKNIDGSVTVIVKRKIGQNPLESFAELIWPAGSGACVELAETKGDRVLVVFQNKIVDDQGRPIGAILRSLTQVTQFFNPANRQVSLIINYLNSGMETVCPATATLQAPHSETQTAITQAFIAAAGDGSRMKPYADCKPLTEIVGGMTMIEALVQQLLAQGVERVGISVRESMAPAFEQVLRAPIQQGKVKLIQEKNAYGDASGTVKALHEQDFISADQPLFIAFADAITHVNLKRIAGEWQALQTADGQPPLAALITRKTPIFEALGKYGYVPTQSPSGSGDGRIIGFQEKPASIAQVRGFFGGILGQSVADTIEHVAANTGMAILSPEFLHLLKQQWYRYPQDRQGGVKQEVIKYFELYTEAVSQNKPLYAINMLDGGNEPWVDGGNGSDLAEGRKAVLTGQVPIKVSPEKVKANLVAECPGVFFNQGTQASALRWVPGISGNADFVSF